MSLCRKMLGNTAALMQLKFFKWIPVLPEFHFYSLAVE